MASLETIVEEFQIGKKYMVTVNPPLGKKAKTYKLILDKVEEDDEGTFYQFLLPNGGGGMIVSKAQLDEGKITIAPIVEEKYTAKPSVNINVNRNAYTQVATGPEFRGMNTTLRGHPSLQEKVAQTNIGFILPKYGPMPSAPPVSEGGRRRTNRKSTKRKRNRSKTKRSRRR